MTFRQGFAQHCFALTILRGCVQQSYSSIRRSLKYERDFLLRGLPMLVGYAVIKPELDGSETEFCNAVIHKSCSLPTEGTEKHGRRMSGVGYPKSEIGYHAFPCPSVCSVGKVPENDFCPRNTRKGTEDEGPKLPSQVQACSHA
jgi:hypothetical protein